MFFEHPPWRAGLVGRACAFRNVGSHSLPSACPATVWVLLSVSQTGLWKRSQGQVRTWNRVINMGCPLQTVTALKIPLWTARWLPQHFFFLSVDIIFSMARTDFLVQGLIQSLGQEPKSTAMTECPNVFGWHTTSWEPGHQLQLSLKPFVAIPSKGVLANTKWKGLDPHTVEIFLAYHLLTHNRTTGQDAPVGERYAINCG
jgi:hypothetical protein